MFGHRFSHIFYGLFFSILVISVFRFPGQGMNSLSACECEREKEQADIWLVDSYHISWNRASAREFQGIRYFRLRGNRWIASDATTFLQTHRPEVPISIFVPGYTARMTDIWDCTSSLIELYDPAIPTRTVIWNWPAEQVVLSLVHDIRKKITVAAASGKYLAMFLQSLSEESRVGIFGFSFGNRIVCDAVEHLRDFRPEGLRIRLMLIGAACDRDALAEGWRNGNVPKIAEKILVLYNPCDRSLFLYRLLYGNGYEPEALGRYGPPFSAILPEYRDRFEAININSQVGIRHRTSVHINTISFRSRVRTYMQFGDFLDSEVESGMIPD